MTGKEILVIPTQLRSTATQLKTTAQRFPQQQPPAEQGVKKASGANRGYLTCTAADNFVDQLKPVLETVEQRIKEQAEATEASAQAWEDADDQTAKDFDELASDIGR
jgi:hypothetical protein